MIAAFLFMILLLSSLGFITRLPGWVEVVVLVAFVLTAWGRAEEAAARSAEKVREKAVQRREEAARAQCERNGGHEAAWPPYPERECPGCQCACHERADRALEWLSRK